MEMVVEVISPPSLAALSDCSVVRLSGGALMYVCVSVQLYSPCSPAIVTTARKQLKQWHERKLLLRLTALHLFSPLLSGTFFPISSSLCCSLTFHVFSVLLHFFLDINKNSTVFKTTRSSRPQWIIHGRRFVLIKAVELCVCVGAQADEEEQTWASVSDPTRMGARLMPFAGPDGFKSE